MTEYSKSCLLSSTRTVLINSVINYNSKLQFMLKSPNVALSNHTTRSLPSWDQIKTEEDGEERTVIPDSIEEISTPGQQNCYIPTGGKAGEYPTVQWDLCYPQAQDNTVINVLFLLNRSIKHTVTQYNFCHPHQPSLLSSRLIYRYSRDNS